MLPAPVRVATATPSRYRVMIVAASAPGPPMAKVGLFCLVMLSVCDSPVSLEGSSIGALVASGLIVSRVRVSRAMLPCVPEALTAWTPMVFTPSVEPSAAKAPAATWTWKRPRLSV